MSAEHFRRLAVGELYNPNVRRWPDGAFNWTLSPVGVELLMTYGRPTSDEVNAVKSGPAQFALVAGDHALILAHRFGAQPWSDAPWQAVRQVPPAPPPGLVEVPPDEHLVVLVVLVDADTGVIKALRATSWPYQFATAVRTAIDRQVMFGGTDDAGQREIAGWYERFPNTTDLVAAGCSLSTGAL